MPSTPDQTTTAQASGLTPPPWATRSVPEDGGILHETISPVRPAVRRWQAHGSIFEPTTVSLSSVDLNIDGTWIRTVPTIQIEGGSYTLDDIRQLRQAIDALLDAAVRDITRQLNEAS